MLNDSIINFYLLYMLTEYIDSYLDTAGIERKTVIELVSVAPLVICTGSQLILVIEESCLHDKTHSKLESP